MANENGQTDQGQDKPAPTQQNDANTEQKPRSKLPLIIAGILLVVVVIAGMIYWLATMGEVSTDDAYTDGNAVSMATNTSGYVTALYVNDNSYVHKGDLLAVVDPRANEAQLAQAQANLQLANANLTAAQVNLREEQVRAPAQLETAQAQLAQAKAQLLDAQRNYRRQLSVDQRATAQTDIDQSNTQLASAEAQVKQADANLKTAALVQDNIDTAQQQVAQREADVAQAQANLRAAKTALSYNYIRAPQDGWITKRNVQLGTYLQAGTQIFYIVTKDFWVTANFKETQLAHMKIGDKVTMGIDAYPSITLHGHVQSIQQGSGAVFTAFPAENATGNFVKIVRRVPVKIVIDSGMPANMPVLPYGISVTPTVHE